MLFPGLFFPRVSSQNVIQQPVEKVTFGHVRTLAKAVLLNIGFGSALINLQSHHGRFYQCGFASLLQAGCLFQSPPSPGSQQFHALLPVLGGSRPSDSA